MKLDKYNKLNKLGARKVMLNKLRKYFNRYIRLRDLQIKGGQIIGECISCKRQWIIMTNDRNEIINNDRKWVAGHYFRADLYKSVEFHPDNVHLQCYRCNRVLSGNLGEYYEGLIKKIGEERYKELESRRNQLRKYNIIEIDELVEKYKDLCKQELKRLNLKI